jgi:hypothetical protein
MTGKTRTTARLTSLTEPLPDFTTMTAGDMTTWLGTDAARWARAFADLELRGSLRPEDNDRVGWLIGWFANAIETGRDAGRRETCPHPAERRQTFPTDPTEGICHACGAITRTAA